MFASGSARALRRALPLLGLALLAPGCVGPSPRAADQYAIEARKAAFSRFFMGLGYRGFGGDWDPVDDQLALQIGGQHQWPSSPIGLEWAWGISGDDGKLVNRRLYSSTTDLSVGPTHTFALDDSARWFLNVGGGGQVSWTYEDLSGSYNYDDDSWFAGYLHANLFWRVGWNWDLGFDFRWVMGEDVETFGDSRDGEYFQVLFGTGFTW